ncbi:hypothetical protein PENTCL1PPCAC_16424, partial [Pristionchus entomophagus]
MLKMLDEYDLPAQIFTISLSCFGVVANSMLLLAIKTRSTKAFRSYSTILINCTTVDLVASIAAALSVTRLVSLHATSTTFLIFTGFCSYAGRLPCWLSHVIANQMWTTSNYFLCFAFAHRFLSIRKRTISQIEVLVISTSIHIMNFLTAIALFLLFLDNYCTAEDVLAARPNYRPIQLTNFEFGKYFLNN